MLKKRKRDSKNMKGIYKKELLTYFTSMIGYIFIAVFVSIMGVYFMASNLVSGHPIFAYSLGSIMMLFVIMVPMLTMRSLSEEKKAKTDQLLLTAPISVQDIVLGKYFAMVSVFAIPMLIACVFPLIIHSFGNSYLITDYSSILAFFLLGCLYISIGTYISSLTESQMIAVIFTFITLLILFLWPYLIRFLPMTGQGSFICFSILLIGAAILIWNSTQNTTIGLVVLIAGTIVLLIIAMNDMIMLAGVFPRMMEKLGLNAIFENFAYLDIFDLEGLLRYISVTILFLFLTVQAIQKSRWN